MRGLALPAKASPAAFSAAVSTRRRRAGLVIIAAIGERSCFAACASSSMKLSTTKTYVRRADARQKRCVYPAFDANMSTWMLGKRRAFSRRLNGIAVETIFEDGGA